MEHLRRLGDARRSVPPVGGHARHAERRRDERRAAGHLDGPSRDADAPRLGGERGERDLGRRRRRRRQLELGPRRPRAQHERARRDANIRRRERRVRLHDAKRSALDACRPRRDPARLPGPSDHLAAVALDGDCMRAHAAEPDGGNVPEGAVGECGAFQRDDRAALAASRRRLGRGERPQRLPLQPPHRTCCLLLERPPLWDAQRVVRRQAAVEHKSILLHRTHRPPRFGLRHAARRHEAAPRARRLLFTGGGGRKREEPRAVVDVRARDLLVAVALAAPDHEHFGVVPRVLVRAHVTGAPLRQSHLLL